MAFTAQLVITHADPAWLQKSQQTLRTQSLTQVSPDMCRWSTENGVQSNTQPAVFQGGMRGLAASSSLPIGETVVSVPEALLISQTTAQESDLVMTWSHWSTHRLALSTLVRWCAEATHTHTELRASPKHLTHQLLAMQCCSSSIALVAVFQLAGIPCIVISQTIMLAGSSAGAVPAAVC